MFMSLIDLYFSIGILICSKTSTKVLLFLELCKPLRIFFEQNNFLGCIDTFLGLNIASA